MQISNDKKRNVSKALQGFREGDAVRAKIVKIDVEKGKINFGIKPKYFSEDQEEEDDDDEDDEEEDEEDGGENGLELKSDDADEASLDGEMDEDDEAEEDDDEEENDEDEDDEEDVDVSGVCVSRLASGC